MEFILPPVGEGLYEVELVRWFVAPGEAVHRGQPLLEVLSDKATMEVPSPFTGVVSELKAEAGEKIKVGQLLLTYATKISEIPITSPAASVLPTTEPAPTVNPSPDTNGSVMKVAAAPSVRLLARRLGIDLATVPGSGPGGRILIDDLAPHISPSSNITPQPPVIQEPRGLDFGVAGTKVKLVGIRRKIAENMTASAQTIPHYSYIDECDVTDLVALRGQLKESFSDAGFKLTYLPFLVKAVCRALKYIPIVNSTYDDATGEISLHADYHIGIAVATHNGLMVPVIRNADQKTIPQIAGEIERLSLAARTGRVRAEDLRDGTFTITSIGSIGGLISTPIIHKPEVGIMGVGKLIRRPVYDVSGHLRPADLIYLSFSFDHRIVDGAIGAAFGNAVIRHLQHPATLLLPDEWK